jgi:hypothetical protein
MPSPFFSSTTIDNNSPQTPYHRILGQADVPDEVKDRLKTEYETLNPFALKRTIGLLQSKLERLVYLRRKGAAG